MITQDEAIAMAREVPCGIIKGFSGIYVNLNEQELTAFANAIRTKTLEEAAVEFDRMAHGVAGAGVFPEKLRRMAKGIPDGP